MNCIMTRSLSSEASTCSDFSGPVTPEFKPRLDLLQFRDDVSIQLGPYRRPVEDIPSMETKFLGIPDSRDALTVPTISRVCFIGAGYVGGPTAAVIALHNPWLHVDVVDKSEARINQWKSRHLPIHEPGLDRIARLVRDGAQAERPDSASPSESLSSPSGRREANLFFSTDVIGCVSKADMIFLAVNTPTKTFGRGAGRATNMSVFDACVDDMVPHAKPNAIIVEKSTVPCGTARRILSKLHARRPGVHFEVLSNPEFLSEGTAIKDLMDPDRVVIGSSRTSSGRMAAEALSRVYSWVPSDRIITSNTWSSELSKLVANAMLAQRISSINSISAICEETGADVNEISAVVGRDLRIGSKFLQSGLGFGGSCFRKDIASLTYLAESLGLDEIADYWDRVNTLNVFQRRRFANRIVRRLNDNLTRKKITILGFAFKKGTADCRESLAADVVRMFLEEQPGEIAIFDPICQPADIMQELSSTIGDEQLVSATVKVYSDPYAACTSADAVLIATDCDQFKITPRHQLQRLSCEAQKDSDPLGITDIVTVMTTNPLTATTTTQRYTLLPPPSCTAVTCQECSGSQLCPTTPNSPQIWSSPLARLHWPNVIRSMQSPAHIFDARHVLDRQAVEELQRTSPCLNFEWIGVRQ